MRKKTQAAIAKDLDDLLTVLEWVKDSKATLDKAEAKDSRREYDFATRDHSLAVRTLLVHCDNIELAVRHMRYPAKKGKKK